MIRVSRRSGQIRPCRSRLGAKITSAMPVLAADNRFAWPLERTPMLLETSLPGVFAAGDLPALVRRRD
jgi:hypothetical protein